MLLAPPLQIDWLYPFFFLFCYVPTASSIQPLATSEIPSLMGSRLSVRPGIEGRCAFSNAISSPRAIEALLLMLSPPPPLFLPKERSIGHMRLMQLIIYLRHNQLGGWAFTFRMKW